jgi:anaerobic sulfite reductase subunit A
MDDASVSAREELYRFLGRIYLMEVDEELLGVLKKLRFPEFEPRDGEDAELLEGFDMMKRWIGATSEEDLDGLAADYAGTFLAAGDATGRAAFPYETFYTGGDGMVERKLEAAYLARGLEPDPEKYRVPFDHLGLMLEYAGRLCGEACRTCDILRRGLLTEQREFVETHLAGWTESFTADVLRCAETDFYRGIAKITDAFIKKETAFLREMTE